MADGAVATMSKPRAVAKVAEAGNPLLGMLGQLATSPNFNPEAFRMIVDLIREEKAAAAKTAYIAAMAELQAALPTIEKKGDIKGNEKDSNGKNTGGKVSMAKYAKWEDVVESIRPVLKDHGFMLSFKTAQPSADRIHVTAILGHREGHTEETTIALPIDSSGAKNNVQGWGSAASYGKRYTAFALLNIAARGEDDDGKAAGDDAAVSADQADKLRETIVEADADIQKFCKYFRIEAVDALPATRFDEAMRLLQKRAKS